MLIFSFLLLVMTLGLVIYNLISRKRKHDLVREESLKLDDDEFIYGAHGGKMTLEQAESDYALIDPRQNDGKPYTIARSITHEESITQTYNKLPLETKAKLNKQILSALIGLIEDRTHPEMILSDAMLNDIHDMLIKQNMKLTKKEIRLIWGS